MAITINGSGTITGISAGGLPDGSVTQADLASTLDLTGKTVTLPSGTGGKILQVVQTAYTTDDSTISTGPSSFTNTGCTASITPSSSSNKILVMLNMRTHKNPGSGEVGARIMRGSSAAFSGISSDYYDTASGIGGNINIQWLDSPSTTSSTTYTAQFCRYGSATAYINRDYNSNNNGVTYLTLMEVSA